MSSELRGPVYAPWVSIRSIQTSILHFRGHGSGGAPEILSWTVIGLREADWLVPLEGMTPSLFPPIPVFPPSQPGKPPAPAGSPYAIEARRSWTVLRRRRRREPNPSAYVWPELVFGRVVEAAVVEDICDLTRLVRSLQRLDGARDCFRSDQTACDGLGCVWRDYCIAPPEPMSHRTGEDAPAGSDP
jgi:hypothetical protein